MGTLGRALVEGADHVKLFGEEIRVAAEICRLPGISGHADVNGLLKWAGAFQDKPRKVFVVHGDDQVTEIFAERLEKELGYDAVAPFSGSVYDLEANAFIYQAQGEKRREAAGKASPRAAAVFERLVAMGRRLMEVIRRNEGGANKDLERFTREIQSLCDKWDR